MRNIKCIKNSPVIWMGLSDLKNAYIEAMVCDEKINPRSVSFGIKALVGALQGDEEVKNMDLTIAKRKTNIHDIEIRALEDEINKLKKELNSRAASEDKNEGGGG